MYACLRHFSGHCVSKYPRFRYVRIKLIVTFSSSDTGTRYLPKQLIDEETVIYICDDPLAVRGASKVVAD